MPEGDTIYRTAVVLRRAMEGARIEGAQSRERRIPCELISSCCIASIEARGKHLLMHLDDGHAIHSHMGMTGSWHIYRPGEPWRKPTRFAALMLLIHRNDAESADARQFQVVCFSPKLLEVLSADRIRHHAHLSRLGPDLLASDFDCCAALERLRSHDAAPLGEAIMNQTITCGVGNVYKSEVLFLCGLDPFAPVGLYSEAELAGMLACARSLMFRNLEGRPRKTRDAFDGGRVWVYGRVGKTCHKCGESIQLRRQGDAGRTTFWCVACQPPRGLAQSHNS